MIKWRGKDYPLMSDALVEYADEVDRLTAVLEDYRKEVLRLGCENARLQARVDDLEGNLSTMRMQRNSALEECRWLRSKACVELRDFETPPYAWTIRFRSTCSTVENAIRNAMATEQEGE